VRLAAELAPRNAVSAQLQRAFSGRPADRDGLDAARLTSTIWVMKAAPLSVIAIQSKLTTRIMGRPFYYLASTGSTNEEAKRLAANGAREGTVLVADEQTAGKGRLGRGWSAPANSCLLMSLLFRPTLSPAQAPRLTMLCSLAAAEAIEEDSGLAVAIKWPNDLVIPQSSSAAHPYRKLGGLLTETAISGGTLLFAVVGMGINVNLDPAELGPVMTPATSLSAELGRPVDRAALLVDILQRIEDRYPQVAGEQLCSDWARRLVTIGQRVRVTSAGAREPVEGVAEGVNPDGMLYVRDLAGNLHLIAVGDVTLRESGS
jgi:BirA family biotin operon repressor/biotin-[acetyl-CoA-carboxylase] ligase